MATSKDAKTKGTKYKKLKTKYVIGLLAVIFTIFSVFSLNGIIAYRRKNFSKINQFSIDPYYTIIFNANNGTDETKEQEISYNVVTELAQNTFENGTRQFESWNTLSDGTGTSYLENEEVLNLVDITLYAQWEEAQYNIIYDLNGGTLDNNNPTTYNINTENFTLNNPTKTGYIFKGWSGTGLVGEENTTVIIEKGSKGDREFTANYTPNTYYIRFNANTGTGSMENQTLTYETLSSLTSNAYTKVGHTFVKWNTKADGTGTSFENMQEIINLTKTNNETIELYAQWKVTPTKYAVQIYGIYQDIDEEGNALGLTFGPATGANYNNAYVTHQYEDIGGGNFKVVILTHNVASDGKETISSEELRDSSGNLVTRTSEQVEQRKDIILHNMTWSEITAIQDKRVFEDAMLCGDTKSVNITWSDPLKTDKAYNQYGDGAGNLSETVNKFYRRWNPTTAQNSYVGSAESGVVLDSEEKSNGPNAINAGGYSSSHLRATLIGENEKTNKGYAGDDNLTSETSIYSCIQGELRDIIIPKRIKYITGTDLSNYGVNQDILDPIWLFSEREVRGLGDFCGYSLEGIGDSGESYAKFSKIDSKYYIPTISHEETNLKITYDENGNPYYWWLRSPSLHSKCIVRGVADNGSIGHLGSSGGIGISFGFCLSDKTQYTVKYNANTGIGAMDEQRIFKGIPTQLNTNILEKEGYVFGGWNTSADGTGTSYFDGEEVTDIGNITLYAQWVNAYTITYNLDGGTLDSANPTTYTQTTENFTLNNPTKEGYTFKGWSGTGLVGDENLAVIIEKGSTGHKEFKANYIPNTYYIKFNPNGGTGAMSNQEMTYGTETALTKNIFTKTDRTFGFWSTVQDGTGTSYLDEEKVLNLTTQNNGIIELFAQWDPPIRYAVQLYGIYQDVDSDGNILGLTFGPATGANYNNAYVTHEYQLNEQGTYNVVIVTHNIASDGTETLSKENLLNSNGEIVTRTAEQYEKRKDLILHNMSWEEISSVLDKNQLEDAMLCGDTKSVKLALNATLKAGISIEQYGDGAGNLSESVNKYYRRWNPKPEQNSYVGSAESGVTLNSKEIFDGPNASQAGGYSSSHIRASLIGENEKTNKGYAGDLNLKTYNCVYSCIEKDLKNLIVPKKIKYATFDDDRLRYVLNEDIEDPIWLFSEREIKGLGDYTGTTLEGLGSQGDSYSKFDNTESKYYLNENTYVPTNVRTTFDENGSSYYWWSRSPNAVSKNLVRGIVDNGSINQVGSSGGIGLGFGFCIGKEYKITYDLDGGTLSSANPETYVSDSETVTLINPTKVGYTFKGWSGTGLVGDENTTVIIEKGSTGHKEFKANYIPNTYYIRFDPNGGTGSMPDQTMTYDVSSKLIANIFTKSKTVFMKWNTKADGTGTSYENVKEVINLSKINNDVVILYAQWSPPVKYAVQIYGIYQDVDENDNLLGLTFGPAIGANYNNAYVTHEYVTNDEGTYNIEVVTTTVAADGTEKQSRQVLKDASGQEVTRTAEQVTQRQNINLHEMTWEEISNIEDKNLFEDCMLCGDTKSVKIRLSEEMATQKIYSQYGDGAGMLDNTVNSYYREWNPSSSNNSYVGSEESGVTLDSNETKYGSNARNAGGYSSSHIRATLIGENEKTNRGYAGDVNLTQDNCLFSCIQEDLRDLIVPKKVKYITGTNNTSGNYSINSDIADSIWLFSEREIRGTGEYSGNELEGLGDSGEAYNKFVEPESKSYIATAHNHKTDIRNLYNEAGYTVYWWLRSPALYYTYIARIVFGTGSVGNDRAYIGNGLRVRLLSFY